MAEPAALQINDEKIRLSCGATLHVRRLQSAPAPAQTWPVLVFLHEALGSVAMWKDVPVRIARASGCPVLLYDRLGHGESDPLPPELNQADYLDKESGQILPELLAACKIEQAVLIGHSNGATIALMAAALLPERISAVVAEAAHLFIEKLTLEGIRAHGTPTARAAIVARVARYHRQPIELIFNRWQQTWLAEQAADWNIEKMMNAVHCPVLGLQGEADEFGSPRQLEALAARVSGPVSTRLLSDCRHIPHFQAPQEYQQEVLQFLARQGFCCAPAGYQPA
jgi:pimeloyl-ACP methyl ester carboxylesterase